MHKDLEVVGLTKLLHESMGDGGQATPLYDPKSLKKIEEAYLMWLDGLDQKDKEKFEQPLYTMLGVKDRIKRPLLVTPLNVKEIDYLKDIGFSGLPPFTRGLHPNMYRGKRVTIRPIVGFGTPEDTNQRIHFLLRHGATGINIVFDLPTIQGYDSDHAYAKGQVGLCGVAIDTVEDMKLLFKEVPLDEVSISLTTHYPSNTMILMSMYLVAAEESGYDWRSLKRYGSERHSHGSCGKNLARILTSLSHIQTTRGQHRISAERLPPVELRDLQRIQPP